MFPDQVSATAPSSERRVHHALRGLSDDWTVIHGVAWQAMRRGRQGDGEADFVLLHPVHGVVVVEVKGGGIDIRGGRWFSTDRDGQRHPLRQSPFDQATDSKRALIAYLRDTIPGLPFLPMGHAVVFPDLSDVGHLGMSAPPGIVWKKSDLGDAAAALRRAVDHWKLEGDIADHIDTITALLAPTTRSRVLLRDTVAAANARLVALTDEQIRVLDGLRRNRQALIYGGAGTGKTVLAVEKARRLAVEGARVLLTCFNRPLADHLAQEFQGIDEVRVNSFHSLCRWQIGQAGMEFPDDPPSEWWDVTAPEALADAAAQTGYMVDAVVVDEGQDFAPAWFAALEALFADPRSASMYVFADSHQMIYQDGWEEPFDGPTYDLSINCRNTGPIAARVASIFGDEPAPLTAEGPEPEWIDVINDEGARARLPGLLHGLINEGQLRPDQVVILTQRKQTCLGLRRETVAGQLLVAPGQLGVAVETIHRFKGLEADCVIVLLEKVRSAREQFLTYVAFSRARAHLTVLAPAAIRDSVFWSEAT